MLMYPSKHQKLKTIFLRGCNSTANQGFKSPDGKINKIQIKGPYAQERHDSLIRLFSVAIIKKKQKYGESYQ